MKKNCLKFIGIIQEIKKKSPLKFDIKIKKSCFNGEH